MNDLIVKRFEGEVIDRDDRVRVIGRARPFAAKVTEASYQAGLTVAELLDLTIGDNRSGLAEDYYVCLDGTPIPREWRARVRAKSGCTITFAPRMNKDYLREIALIALAIVAIVAVPFLAPLVGGAAWASVITAGIVVGGSLAVNALFPAAPPEVSPTKGQGTGRSKVFSIQGAQNTADPFGPIPSIYGRVRVWPRYAALPYTEFSGTTQYLRLLFCIGYGPIRISDLRIGQTDTDDLDDIEVEIKEGYGSDNTVKLYPGTVFQEQLSIELDPDDGYFERTTAEDIDEIVIDISAPGGIYKIDHDTGKYEEISLEFNAQYRETGDVTWLDLDSYDQRKKSKKPWRKTFRKRVDRGQYDVRVRKTSDVNDDENVVVQDLYWTALTGLRNDPPIDFHKPLALVAIRIKATGQLNNVIETFNCMAEARTTGFRDTDSVSWDPSNKHANITLSSSNRVATLTSQTSTHYQNARSTQTFPNALDIFRVTITTNAEDGENAVGIMNSSASLGGAGVWLGYNTNSMAIYTGGDGSVGVWFNGSEVQAFDGELRDGGIVDVCVDRAANKAWFRFNNGPWNNDTDAVPSLGTGSISIASLSGTLYAGITMRTAGGVMTAHASEPVWFEYQRSRNPAAAFRWVLQGPAINEPVPDEQIDLDAIEAWGEYCDDEGWEYNFEHDRRISVFDTLRMVAASGRARVVRTDGKWGVIWDEADVAVAQHFTPRNSWGFEEQRVYFDPPDAYRVNFVNEDKDYQPDERKVYADDFSASNATKFEALEFPGVTDPGNVWRLGRFQMAQALLRPATYTLMTNWQALSCTVGSRVYVAHDVAEWGLAQARVVAASGDTITIDEDFVFELGTEYLLRFRQADGTSVIRAIELPSSVGVHRTITLIADIDLPDPEVGDLVMFGEDIGLPAVLLRVQEIEWLPDLRARITMVDDAPGIADADSGDIPAFDSQITAPQDLYARPPTNLAVAEQIYIRDGAFYADAVLSWLALASYVTGFEIEMRDDNDVGTDFEPLAIVGADEREYIISDLTPGSYSFRVRSMFTKGTFSSWTELNVVTFTGTLSRPDDVTNFRISVLGDTATLTWDAILGQAVAYYVVRHSTATSGAAWGSASVLLERVIGSSVQVPAVNGTFLIKAVTSAGAESLDPAMIIFTGQQLVVLNVVELIVPEPTWFGLLTDLTIDTARLKLTAADVEGEFLYHDFVELGETFTSRVAPSILAFGNDPTNVMASWDTLLEVDNLAGSTPADWRVVLEERHVEQASQIDTSLGTNIGDMTASGGLAAAFDGQTSETEANCAVRAGVTSSYVGKTLAAPAAITHAVVYGSSNNGLTNSATGTLYLYGKQGSAPASATDGTLLDTRPFTDQDATAPQLLVSSDPDTLWDHVWVRYTTASTATNRCAELELFENTFEGWTDWQELRLSDITARAYQFRLTLTTLNPSIDVHVEEADISVDMPDRIEAIGDLAVGAGGTTYTYSQPFRHVETVVVTAIQNATSGDYATISNRTEESFDIIVRNSVNAGVARTVDAVAAGYGRRIS